MSSPSIVTSTVFSSVACSFSTDSSSVVGLIVSSWLLFSISWGSFSFSLPFSMSFSEVSSVISFDSVVSGSASVS